MSAIVTKAASSIGKLHLNGTALFLCDMQEKFRSSIEYFDDIILMSNRLLHAFKILELPVVCTEQYPKGLGNTVKELEIEKYNIKPYTKTKFSMCSDTTMSIIKDQEIKSIILCGIECHVCIQNTALDLLEMGVDVHIPVDAVSSRSLVDRSFAIDRMRDVGVFISTSESIILSLIGGSHHPQFKTVQQLILKPLSETGLFTKQSH